MKKGSFPILEPLKKEKRLIVLCFILAFISWQGIHRNTGFEVSVANVPIDITIPEDWAVWEKSVHQVNITFRGPREAVRYLNNEQIRMVIPVTDPNDGEEITIKLSAKHLKNPSHAKAIRFSPSEIVIKLDQEIERMLPVKATLSGMLYEGTEIDKIACSPASVRVSGARNILEKMDNIHTEAIQLNNRQTSFKESVPVALPKEGRMQVDPDWVSVDFSLVQRSSTQDFENIPVQTLCTPNETRKISLTPHYLVITVKGQTKRLEQMEKMDIFAYVNCTKLTESTSYDLPVTIDLPAGLQIVKTTPSSVHVTVQPK